MAKAPPPLRLGQLVIYQDSPAIITALAPLTITVFPPHGHPRYATPDAADLSPA